MKDPSRETNERAHSTKRLLRQSAVIVLFGSASGFVSNLVRSSERLPLIATKPYEITVPCPEPIGSVTATPPTSSLVRDFTTLVIDARSGTDFAAWHVSGALNVPFDWLGPPVEEEVKQLARRVAAAHAQRLLVYGDGDNPDSGREWARLLAYGGIRNVSYVEGGAPALRAVLEPTILPQAAASQSSSPMPSTLPAPPEPTMAPMPPMPEPSP